MIGLKRTAVTGFLWQAFGSLGQRGAAFVATLVLARFLPKEDFGVVGVALAVVAVLELFRDGGVANAVVTYQGDEERLPSTAFWMLLLPGVVLCSAVILFAPVLEAWFEYPRLAMVLRAMAAAQFLDTFRIVPNALMGRRHMFRQRSIADTSAVVVAMIVAIGSLFVLPPEQQIWSLAFMWIVRYIVAVILFNLFLPVVPRFVFDRPIARKLARTGFGMLLSNIPSGSTEWITALIVGGRTHEATMGMFRVGTSLALPAALIGNSANITLFPILAQQRDDMSKFVERSLRSIRAVNVLTLAFVGWFIVVAPDLVPVLLGERWSPAVPAAQWITIATALKAYTFLCSTPLLACEKNGYAAAAWWCAFAAMVVLMPFVPFGRDDATTPAMLFAAVMGTGAIAGFSMLRIGLKVPFAKIGAALAPGLILGAVSAAAAFGLLQLLGAQADWQRLLAVSAVYGLVFLPLCGKIMGEGWLSLLRPSGWRSLIRSPGSENDQSQSSVQP